MTDAPGEASAMGEKDVREEGGALKAFDLRDFDPRRLLGMLLVATRLGSGRARAALTFIIHQRDGGRREQRRQSRLHLRCDRQSDAAERPDAGRDGAHRDLHLRRSQSPQDLQHDGFGDGFEIGRL